MADQGLTLEDTAAAVDLSMLVDWLNGTPRADSSEQAEHPGWS